MGPTFGVRSPPPQPPPYGTLSPPAHRENGGLPRPATALSFLGASLTDKWGPLVAAAVDARGCRAQVHCVMMGGGSILQTGSGIHAGQ